MTHVMQVSPPQFAPGPVDGAALTAAFATFYQYVLARMDLRYPQNDFGGLGSAGEVLTSTGVAAPIYMPVGFPSVANDTVIGNVSGGPAPAVGLTQAQLTSLVNLVTSVLSGAIPAYPGDATKFFNGNGAYTVPSYPVAANPSAKVGTTTVNGAASTFMRSDAAPALDLTTAYNFTGGLQSGGVNVSTATGANPSASVGLSTINGSAATWMRSDAAPPLDQSIVPTWTGLHVFTRTTGTPITINNSVGDTVSMNSTSASGVLSRYQNSATDIGYVGSAKVAIGAGLNLGDFSVASNAGQLLLGSNGSVAITVSTTQAVSIAKALGVNGNSAPSQVTGWGTPTGGTVVNNFSGTLATLLQTSEVVAQIITDLKALGIYGA